ncbi:cadherin-related family member 5 isoform X3 [Hemibagrus wyckioides]|uniref:cadherin-related family member 5 isoform X3 n=1 Tax=Hemibagrus wyckioides TaxID=337641 RepID=UPI00266C5949|nr:cadherin-related family member 5 isoform X3 [Hemibagrus wyckioides]
MDLKHLISLKIVLFLLSVLTINTSAQICIAPAPVEFNETNKIGETVTTIVIQEGVTLQITANPYDAFGINGSLLVANKVLDYETLPDGGGLTVGISCMKDGVDPLNIRVYVIVKNINDNAPVFANNMYTLQVDELSKVGTSVGKIEATDLDGDRLYYRLESPMEEFGLQTDTNPVILVKKVLDYDTIKEVTLKLFAQDTPLSSPVVHTTSTNIIVSILDINNRPPWFQPCTESIVGTTKICLSPRYTGTVNLNEQAAGPLTLQPGPVHAIDGDKGRNDPIRYTIIEGNTNDTFIIDQQSGAITMQKPVGSASSITLIVMAYELENPDLFATTTVTLQVVISSNHKPQFVKPKYEGFISEDAGVGSLVLESKSTNIPLQVQATDADFSDGINPHIKFEVPVDSDFKITPDGFIIMTRAASPGNVNLQIIVVDATNSESSTASLSVEVIAEGVPLPSGDFRTEDMIALGVSLAVALLLCFVVIGFLAYTLRRFNADWRKLTEASIFRSSLSGGSGGPKDGVQYTNEGFQADEDADSLTSKEAAELPLPQGPELNHKVTEILETQHSVPSKSSNGSFTLPTDSSSQNALDNTDNEKEVKPILTKERRMEEGYKAVWFKEDIDPNDKDEVVISERDQDIDHEDDDDDDDFDNDVNGDDNYDDEKEEEDSNFAHL